MRTRTGLTIVAILALGAPVATAQSNDAGFRGWAYLQEVAAPRAAGLGGAFVGLADDASAVAFNPAGLATLQRTEITGSGMDRASGRLANGDATRSRNGIGFIGGAGKLSKSVALGAYIAQPHDVRISLGSTGGAEDTGFLQTTVTDVGLAVAWNPAPKVYLGLRASISHLALAGEVVHVGGPAGYAASTAAKQDRLSGDFGVLLQPTERVGIGLAFTQGSRWDAIRASEDATGRLAPALAYQISSPSRLAGGVAVHLSPQLLATAELDYLLLSRLQDTVAPVLQPASASDYALQNAVEPRAGVEFSIPVQSAVTVELRAGVYSAAPAALRFVGSTLPQGASAFPGGERKTIGTVGASVTTHSFGVDVAGSFGGQRTVLVGGATVKF